MKIRRIFAALLLSLIPSVSYAITPGLKIAQYGHSTWRVQQDQIPGVPITRAVQTKDGFLWIGTLNGLLRFDGLHFAPWHSPDGNSPLHPQVTSLFSTDDGKLWIGTAGGLSVYRDGELFNYTTAGPGAISAIAQDSSGTVWVTRYAVPHHGGGLCRVDRRTLTCFGSADGLPDSYGVAVAGGGSGQLWWAGSAIYHGLPGSFETFFGDKLKSYNGSPAVQALIGDGHERAWAALDRTGPGLGLEKFSDGRWRTEQYTGFDGGRVKANSLYLDHHGALWVGTASEGVFLIWNGRVDHYRYTDGLTSDSINGISEDSEGNIWITTDNGVDCFRDSAVASWDAGEGLTHLPPTGILAMQDGSVWISETKGIDILSGGAIRSIPAPLRAIKLTSHPTRTVRKWMFASNDRLIGDDGSVVTVDWRKPDRKGVYDFGSIDQVVEDTPDSLWALHVEETHSKLLHILKNRVAEEFDIPDITLGTAIAVDREGGILIFAHFGRVERFFHGRFDAINATHYDQAFRFRDSLRDSSGDFWVAGGAGLYRYRDQRWNFLGAPNGLPCPSIFALQEDNRRNLWIYANCGLIEYSHEQLLRWEHNPSAVLSYRLFDANDGVLPGGGPDPPRSAKDTQGRLWFISDRGAQVIDPAHLPTNRMAPPVSIEAIVADGKTLDLRRSPTISGGTHNIEIDYAGLSFTSPDKVRFRYELVGVDPGWIDAGDRRSAFFMNLAPGHYRFHVVASNNDGLWNNVGAEFDFVVKPTFTQTVWYRLLLALASVLCIYLIFTARMRVLSWRMQSLWVERVRERERIARDLHDTFLQGMQGVLLHFTTLARNLPDETPLRQAFDTTLDKADKVMTSGRALIQDLRGPENSDILANELRLIGRELQGLYPVAFEVEQIGRTRSIQATSQDEICKTAREAILNAFRHSKASHITVTVEYARTKLIIRVRDDGQGIPESILRAGRLSGHWGLPGMKERTSQLGGILQLRSTAGVGTEVTIQVPSRRVYRTRFGFRWI